MSLTRLFVCTNQKSGVGEELAKALKKEIKAQGLKKRLYEDEVQGVRVQTCNCLDLCKHCKKGPGAALLIYPEGTAYGDVRPAHAAELIERHLGRGQELKKLKLKAD